MSNVAVLGASTNPERYAFKARKMLQEHGHEVYPVAPGGKVFDGVPAFASLTDIAAPIDTVTVYINPTRLAAVLDDLVAAGPRRVILNPGTESETLKQQLEQVGIHVVEACTLVLLSTGQFDEA
jgi:predicted CoA-binding protein